MTEPLEELDTLAIATRIVYELLGRRWVWPAITTTETVEIPWSQPTIVLHGRPVIEIISISQDGGTTQLPYTLENKFRVRLTNRPGAKTRCCGLRKVSITYKYGSPPPEGLRRAILLLQEELDKSIAGDTDCQLPQGVTSVSRQGITMNIVDVESFVARGLTGISDVDEAIRLFNPTGAKRPVRIYSRRNPPPRRTNTTQAEN